MTEIAQVLLSPRTGGAESIAATLEEEWSRLGVSSEILYLDPRVRRSRVDRVLELRRSINHIRPRAVLAHSATPAAYARIATTRAPVFTVLHSASDDYEWWARRHVERILGPRTAGVIAVSRGQAESYAARFGAARRPRTIYPGIQSPDRLDLESRASRPLRRIVTVARLAEQKNPPLWLEAAQRVRDEIADVTFDWWGPVAPDEHLMKKYLEVDFGPGLRFRGGTSEVSGVLSSADLMFHPSDREAPGLSMLEAAAHGLPVVCSDRAAENLPTGISVMTFAAGDASSASEVLLRAIADWPLATIDAGSQAALMRENHSPRSAALAYLDAMRITPLSATVA